MENNHNTEQLRLERARKRVKALSGFYKHLGAYLLVNIFLIAIQFFTRDQGEEFWEFGTFSTAFFWGIGLAFHALNVFGRNFFLGDDWEERKIRELMERNRNTNWE